VVLSKVAAGAPLKFPAAISVAVFMTVVVEPKICFGVAVAIN
jgi:hypothetical protein